MHIDVSQIDLFRGLPPDGLARLAMLSRTRIFSPGSLLMRRGHPSGCLYIIVQGRVRLEDPHPDLVNGVLLPELGPGAIVGVMELLDGEPCRATVTAVEEIRALELGRTALALILLQYPEAARALLSALRQLPRTVAEPAA